MYNPAVHHRRSIRLKEYDYSCVGAYFITICTHHRLPLFGTISPAPFPTPSDISPVRARFTRAPSPAHTFIELSDLGRIALDQWFQLPNRFPTIELGAFVVMPNHVHGIIIITDAVQPEIPPVRARVNRAPTPALSEIPANASVQAQVRARFTRAPSPAPTLGDIVGAYKSLVANECLQIYKTKNEIMGKLWQRNYYEHIIRDQIAFENITSYIENNIATWRSDRLFESESK